MSRPGVDLGRFSALLAAADVYEHKIPRTGHMTLLRVYQPDELDRDGYPAAWRRCPSCGGEGLADEADEFGNPHDVDCNRCSGAGSIKNLIREQAGHRCVRCGHPYRIGEHGAGEWTPCDGRCTHDGPLRLWQSQTGWVEVGSPTRTAGALAEFPVEARWRILTVHHLNGDKADCRWWNLASLCQRCHLTVQGRVIMERGFLLEHSDWFKPYAAGWYAWKYEGLELSREETLARLDELLALERAG